MGSSESSVGSIVWVRRRNGSWWPGKILGPNDLSGSHLTSPRSGTPVKLLGREDASVDWYNLEKSKRVKAFRCGEFDDCIERAEASLGLPVKKREKYARREDAILHALELEKKYIVKKHGKLALTNFMRENASDEGRRVFATTSLALENGNGKPQSHELYQLDKKIDASSMTERNNAPAHEYKHEDRTYHNLRGHNTEERHLMKRLQDFGLGTVPVNRMIHTSAVFEDSKDPCFESSSDSDLWKPISKGKKSLEGFVEVSLPRETDYSLQHDFDFISMYEKREDGEGGCEFAYFPGEPPMVFDSHSAPQEQVEMLSSRLDAVNSHRGTFAEETASGSSEETESDSSENNHFLEPHVEAAIMLSDVETRIKAQARTTDSLGMREGDEIARNDVTQKVSVHDMSQFYLPEPNSSGFGVSKWLIKRKRNARNFSKRPMSKFSRRTYLEERDGSLNDDNDSSDNDVDFTVGDFEPSTRVFVKSGFLPSQTTAKDSNIARKNTINWEELAWGRPSRDKCFNLTPVGRNAEGLLIDVDLKVQTNYQGENVPWVSLTSRLNGKAIIGHPVQIEALEDGSTDILVSSIDLKSQYFRQSGKVRSKNSAPPPKKSHTHKGKKKKTNPSSNHDTETLSSFGFNHRSRKRRREKNPNYLTDEAIKSVDSNPPVVACVPVKLVFSRLLEATRGVSMNSRNRSLSTL